MKKIGILGGMSHASSQLYYQILCDITQSEFGGLHSPNLILRSVNFAPLAALMHDGDWGSIAETLHQEAVLLEKSGAELLVLATNTMHKLADQMMLGIDLPFVHIADATANAVKGSGLKSPAFIATKFTMEERFYLDRLEVEGLDPFVPNQAQRDEINRIIFEELCRNEVNINSQKTYLDIVADLKQQGADSVILGCTEVCLLLNEENAGLPVFDTTRIHCKAAFNAAI